MHVHAGHSGARLPFERNRRLVLRRLPVSAVITRAALTLTPVSTDPAHRFLETLAFPAGSGAGDWGASKVVTTGAVEVALHARRRLASLTGSGLANGPLLVDLGGGLLGVDADGGFSNGPPLLLTNAADLPGVTVTGLRVPQAGADVSVLRVSSPPSNVTLAVEGGPVFFTHFGDLVDPVTTPDLADVLQAMLADLDVENGCFVVPFVLHSDTIARIDVDLELELGVAVSAAPPGVRTVQAPYRFDGTPVADAGRLAVRVPPGMVAVAGGTTGRVQGAFATTRVVHGPVTEASAVELVPVEAGRALAQPFVTPGTVVASSVDLLLTAVTADVTLAVDLVGDLDGKPGRASLLPRPVEVALTRDTAGLPTWVNVPLPGELEVLGTRRQWLVVQARTGSATWSAGPGPAPEGAGRSGPAMQQTRDGGLSWRAAVAGAATAAAGASGAGGLSAALRLRHSTAGFRVPVELRVGTGADEVGVSLQRFAASGSIDFGLDFPEVADAVNTAISAAGGGAVAGGGEQVANGDFATWYRVGTTVRPVAGLQPAGAAAPSLAASAFSPDGARVVVAGRDDTAAGTGPARTRLVAFDVLSRDTVLDGVVADGGPHALAFDATGRRLVVASAPEADFSTGAVAGGGSLTLVDPATGQRTGAPVPVPEPTAALVPSADGRGVYLAGADLGESGARTVLRHVDWVDLTAASGGSPVDWDHQLHDTVTGLPLGLASSPDGRVLLLVAVAPVAGVVATAPTARLVSYAGRGSLSSGDRREVDAVDLAVGLVCTPRGEVLVLAEDRVRYVRATDLATLTEVQLGAGGAAHGLALDPEGVLAVVARADGVGVLDVPGRRMFPDPGVGVPHGDGLIRVSVSPAGTHAALTRSGESEALLLSIGDALPAEWELTAGKVQPVRLPATGEVLAMLGDLRGGRRKGSRAEPAAMSQVVPVVGGAQYRFGFDGVALVDGAVAQVRWRGDACSTKRTDRVPVPTFDPEQGGTLDRVPRHDGLLVAPAGATNAEIRFFTPEWVMVVDRVTLRGSADVATTTWLPSLPSTTVTPADEGFTLSNGGTSDATVGQVVAVTAGDDFDLQLSATAGGEPGAVVEVAFADEAGVEVEPVVQVPLDVLDLDAHAASGVVPAGAVEAALRFVLPPGAVVDLAALSLTVGASTQVGLYFASEAPGDLSMTDVGVTLDRGEPRPVPVPSGGLCQVTPAGEGEDGEACYCQACGRHGPATKGRAVRTDAGRPALLTPCPTCGAARVRAGGRPALRAEAVDLPRYRAVDRGMATADAQVGVSARTIGASPRTAPALVSRLRVDLPVTEVAFVGEVRAAQLAAAGVRDVVALARADRAMVAALPGVSERLAEKIVASAAELVRTRGERVVFDL